MSDPTASTASRAVFLSYAHEDGMAAHRIAEALREAGIEVWFDQSELRGGDAWDQKIRQQIKECALFVPIVSANTQERGEGYFRLEWKLAVERTHLMAEGIPFLTPVALDRSHEADALVPAEFMRVHWTRLPNGEVTPEFVGQIKRLLEAPRKSTAQRKAESAGSKFVAASAASATPLPSPSSAPVAGATAASSPPAKSRFVRWLTLGLVGLALVVIVYVARQPGTKAPSAFTPAAAPHVDPKSIAILPFDNISEDKTANAFFAEGVHEDILTNLGVVRVLHVTSRTSVMQYRATTKPIRQIGAELGVAYVLEGSVRRAGDKVRVTGQLIDARTDEHVWAKSYDRDLTDIFALQAELSQEIARALSAALSPQEKTLIERKRTTHPAAYDLYVKARAQRRGTWGPDMLKAVEALLSRAVEIDSGFAEAWAELADCRAQFAFDDFDHSAETRAAGRLALDKALQLAPESAVVIASAGDYYFHSDRDYARAADAYRRVVQLQPNNGPIQASLAAIERRQGHWTEALGDARRALALDPHSGECFTTLYALLSDARRYGEAEALARQRLALAPEELEANYSVALAAYLARGSTAESEAFARHVFPPELQSRAFADRKRLARLSGNFAEAVRLDREQPVLDNDWSKWSQKILLAVTLANAGDLAGARGRVEAALPEMLEALTQEKQNSWLHAWLGQAYALIGEKEKALQHARTSVEILPASRDAVFGLENETMAAAVFAWVGEKDRALAEIARLLRTPHGGSVRVLRHGTSDESTMISWRPLLDDPRFQALLANPANDTPLF